jgi:hypothetical protein
MTIGNVFENMPDVLPEGEIVVKDEVHEFTVLEYDTGDSSTKFRYQLNKAPIENVRTITGTVDGNTYTFQQNVDYIVIDANQDGEPDTVDFSVGGVNPDDNTEFYVTYVAESVVSRYIASYEDEVSTTNDKIDAVIASREVDNATGDDLDRIGALFGELGRRRGRPDAEYRAFLKSIVQSFKGRGTIPGLKFAIAAGIGTDPENIIINEDFEEVGYTITIENTDSGFLTKAINDLAQLADPSGVELLSPPVLVSDPKPIDIAKNQSQVTTEVGLGGGTLDLDGSKTLGGPN